jgi:hypothetical protein
MSDMEGEGCCSNGADDDGSFASRYTQPGRRDAGEMGEE